MPANRQRRDEADEIAAAGNGTIQAPNAFRRMVAKMDSIAELDTSMENYTGDDIARILEAETEDEMWEADEVPSINAKMLSGCALEMRTFTVKYSADTSIATPFIGTDGKRMYLLVESVRLDRSGEKSILRLPEPGTVFTWNTSARYIVAKMFWALEHGYFTDGRAFRARIVGTELPGGRSVEKLKPVNAPVMAGASEEPPF